MTSLHVAGMDELSEAYCHWLLAQRISQETVIARNNFLRRVRDEIGDPATVTAPEIAAWLAPRSGWTLSSYFSAVRSVMTFMHETGRRPDHPMSAMRRPPRPKSRPKPFTDDEVQLILTSARREHRVQLELGLYLGLRAHEVAKFEGQDVTARWTRVLGKGGKVATLPTHPVVLERAQEYPRSGLWFPTSSGAGHVRGDWISTKTSRLLERLGMEGSFHRCRATFGTRLLRNGVNIKVVQELMRHDSLESTQHYLGTDVDELSDAIGSLGFGAAA